MDENEVPDKSGAPAGSAVPQPINMLVDSGGLTIFLARR